MVVMVATSGNNVELYKVDEQQRKKMTALEGFDHRLT